MGLACGAGLWRSGLWRLACGAGLWKRKHAHLHNCRGLWPLVIMAARCHGSTTVVPKGQVLSPQEPRNNSGKAL